MLSPCPTMPQDLRNSRKLVIRLKISWQVLLCNFLRNECSHSKETDSQQCQSNIINQIILISGSQLQQAINVRAEKAMAPHGWRSLVGCSPWGHWRSDTTGRLHFHFSLSCVGEGNGNLLQCSCLENPRDRGAWWAAVYGVTQSRTRLK